jgi:amidase
MNRRDVLKWGLAGTTAALAAANAASDGGTKPTAAPDAGTKAAAPFAQLNLSLRELQAQLTAGAVTTRALVESYLARIDTMNAKGPELRAYLETNPDALALADSLDQERKEKGPRGPLHGIPLAIKDNIDTGDGMETTAGSLALLGTRAKNDAFIVKKLRDAGALLLGKANLSEWANMRSSRSVSGWSARGGQGRNPYALDRSPIGSSSGSGIAVAADLCAAAIGTETDGSITAPASAMALVGLKPTVGLLSRAGIIPISATQDTPGPMTRTVEDAALLLNAMVGEDPADAATAGSTKRAAADYTKDLRRDALKGVRLGVVRNLFGGGPALQKVLGAALDQLKALGAVLIDCELKTPELSDAETDVLLFELKAGLADYLAKRRPDAPLKTLADLIAFNLKNADRELSWFGQELFERAQAKGPLTSPAYKKALDTCRKKARTGGIDALTASLRLDAFVTGTLDPAWIIDPLLNDPLTAFGGSPAAVAGYPSLTVPAGDVGGLPVGLLFFATAFREPALLSYGYAYEQASLRRALPTYAKSVTPRV